MLRIEKKKKKVKCSTSCQQADVKPFESHSWNTEHCLNNRRWWESQIILHEIPNTAYRLNTAYIVAITSTNTRTISWNAFIQRGGRKKAGLSRKDEMLHKIFLPALSETSDGIHTLSWNILILFRLTIFFPTY